MLQQRVFAYRSGKHVSYTSQQNEMPEIKKRFPEYRNIHSLAMQDVARRLEKAFDNFYRRIKDLESGKM